VKFLRIQLFDESPGSHVCAKPLVQVRTVGPQITENEDTNGHRDVNDEDFEIIQNQKPSLVI
jgi:hypothetical protein